MKTFGIIAVLLISLTSSDVLGQNGRGGGQGRGGMNSPDQKRALAWLQEFMPNLYIAATRPSPRQNQLKGIALNHFRIFDSANMAGKARLRETYKNEDAIHGLVLDLEKTAAENREALRATIQSKMRQLLENNFDDREARIAKLKTDLADEEKRLVEDRQNIDQIAEKRLRNQFGFYIGAPTTAPSTRPSLDPVGASTGNTIAAPQP